MAKTLVGTFDDLASAQDAVRALRAEGVESDHVRLMANDDASTGNAASTSAAASTGDAGDVPWTEKVSSWFNSLVDDDADNAHAGHYAEAVRRGHYVVVADVESTMVDRAVAVLNRFGTVDMTNRVDQWKRNGYSGAYDRTAAPFTPAQRAQELASYTKERTGTEARDASGNAAIPVVQEELEVGKRVVQRGAVRIHSYVEERPVEEVVRLRNERIDVQRRPVDRAADRADLAFKERTIDVKAMGEEAVVGKRARVVEEVSVGKQTEQHDETIKETVRRQDVKVENIAGGATNEPALRKQ